MCGARPTNIIRGNSGEGRLSMGSDQQEQVRDARWCRGEEVDSTRGRDPL